MPKLRLLTPGPTPLSEPVKKALSLDMIHHRKQAFQEIFRQVQKDLQYLFGTQQPVLILTCSGTGAMEASVLNLFNPGEKVVVINGGKFGQRWKEIAQSRELDVVEVKLEWGKTVQLEQLSSILDQNQVQGVLVQASETSTGVLHPIEEIAALCKQKNVLCVVDGISAVGISPCPMDKWGIDCLLTGSQKGLGLPPGLGFVALSQKAWDKVAQVKARGFYFDLLREKQKQAQAQTAYTPAINLIVGLAESLKYFREKGLAKIYQKQRALTELVRTGLTQIGLELLAKTHYTWGLTSVILPVGIDGNKLLAILAEKYGYLIAGGQDHLKGKIVRIGHMGYVDYVDLSGCLFGLRQALLECGWANKSRHFLENAMEVYWKIMAKEEDLWEKKTK